MENTWVTLDDIVNLKASTLSKVSLFRKAKKDNWTKRQKKGVKGVAYEFLVQDLPFDIQDKIKSNQLEKLLISVNKKDVNYISIGSNSKLDITRQCPAILENKTAELMHSELLLTPVVH